MPGVAGRYEHVSACFLKKSDMLVRTPARGRLGT